MSAPGSYRAHSGVDPLTGLVGASQAGEPASWADASSDASRWELRGLVGVGGMGQVHVVYDRRLQRELAMKVPLDAADARRLRHEALVTARLDHPGIVAVYDAGAAPDGAPWFAMRLVRGSSLLALLERAEVDRAELLRHVLAAAQAVAFAHSRGVVHRDLKPANVMTGPFGETQVIDWGLALAPDLPSPDLGRAGTPTMMAPEQARGEPLDARCDVYALGAILRHVATGSPIFPSSSSRPAGRTEVLETLAAESVPPIPLDSGVPAELTAIITRATAADRDERYPDAAAFAEDLARYLDGRRVLAHRYSARDLAWRALVAWRVPLTIAAVGLVALAVVTALAIQRIQGEARETARALAAARVAQARAALNRDDLAASELLARAAYAHEPVTARGVLMTLPPSAPDHERLAALDQCQPADVVRLPSGVTRVLCRTATGLEVRDDGARRWAQSVPNDEAALVGGGRQIIVLRREARRLETFDAASGAALSAWRPTCRATGFAPGGGDVAVGWNEHCVARFGPRGEEEVRSEEHCASGLIRAAGLSRDGGHWVMVCADGTLVVGAFSDGDDSPGHAAQHGVRFDARLPHTPASRLATFATLVTPDRVLVGNDAGQVWDVDLADVAGEARAPSAMVLGGALVRHLAVSPDGAQAVASLDGEAPIVVDLGRRAILGRLPGARGAEGARVAYDDDGRFTVAAAELTRWDFRALLPRQLSFPTGITDLAVSRDGRRLAVAWNDTVQVLDPVGRTVSATHRLDERRLASDRAPFVKAIALAPDGDMLVASTLSDAALARFDPFTPLPPLSGGDAGSSHRRLGVLPDGSVLGADYDRSVRRLTPEGPTRIGAATTAERAPEAFAAVDLAVSPSGEWAVAVTLDGGLYRAHGVESGGLFEPLARAPRAVAVAIEDDGAAWSASSDGVRGWSAASVERTPLSAAAGNLVAVAAAGGLVAAGAKDGAIYVWKQGEPSPWAVVRDHRKRVDTLVIEPRGRFIAAGSWDGRLSFLRWPDEPVGEGVAEAERRWGIGLDELGDAPP